MFLQSKDQSRVLRNQSNPKKIKYLAINVMGVAGVILAIIAIAAAQDQSVVIHQITQELSQTSFGSLVSTIKSLI